MPSPPEKNKSTDTQSTSTLSYDEVISLFKSLERRVSVLESKQKLLKSSSQPSLERVSDLERKQKLSTSSSQPSLGRVSELERKQSKLSTSSFQHSLKQVPAQEDQHRVSGTEVSITLRRRKTPNTSGLGLKYVSYDGLCLEVDEITDGLIKTWNLQNPQNTIGKDDRIISCNGAQDSAEQILDAIRSGDVLDMKIIKAATRAQHQSC